MRERGYTLLELLACLALVALLASLAVPGLRESWLRARRSEAVSALLRMQLAQERFYIERGRYAADLAELHAAVGTPWTSEYYRLAAVSTSADQYRLEATATGPQGGDRTPCLVLAINQRGERSPPETTGCWR